MRNKQLSREKNGRRNNQQSTGPEGVDGVDGVEGVVTSTGSVGAGWVTGCWTGVVLESGITGALVATLSL